MRDLQRQEGRKAMKKSIALAAALGGMAGLVLAIQVRAGGDKVAFPENYAAGVLYGTVDRYDNKQYRELYATPAAVDAARSGQPIPSGTVLTMVQYKAQLDAQGNPLKDANGRFIKGDLVGYAVMEKRTGWGTEYPDHLRNGEWEYQSFLPDRKVNDKANLTACFGCHKPHEGQDFVISLASLKGTQPGQMAEPRPGPGVVSIANFLFGPEQVSVAPGTPITWFNTDGSPHQVTIRGSKPQRTAVLLKGQSASLTIAEPGTYEYICGLHPNMKGKIEVK
jgi:plastocyanin